MVLLPVLFSYCTIPTKIFQYFCVCQKRAIFSLNNQKNRILLYKNKEVLFPHYIWSHPSLSIFYGIRNFRGISHTIKKKQQKFACYNQITSFLLPLFVYYGNYRYPVLLFRLCYLYQTACSKSIGSKTDEFFRISKRTDSTSRFDFYFFSNILCK